MVCGHTLIVFPFATYASFTILQSRIHQIWSAFLGPTMKDDLRYTPSDCLETFPFPLTWETASDLEANGESYYAFRADLMVRAGEGLTKTYNRFHDPHEDSPEIATLRSLHAAIDRAVLDAYGWRDISTDCEFLLDHEIDEEAWGARKKAVPLPLAERGPRRGACTAAGTQRPASRRGSPFRQGSDVCAAEDGTAVCLDHRASGQRPRRGGAASTVGDVW